MAEWMLQFLVGDCSTVQLSWDNKSSWYNKVYVAAAQIDYYETRACCPFCSYVPSEV